jgi:hypothetical protein
MLAYYIDVRNYLDDNGLELTWDRPRDKRPNPLPAGDRPLDLDELLNELASSVG